VRNLLDQPTPDWNILPPDTSPEHSASEKGTR
jgi:hypothetical protein